MKRKGIKSLAAALVCALFMGGCGVTGTPGNAGNGSAVEQETQTEAQDLDYEALFREMKQQDYMRGEWQAGEVQNPLFYRKIDSSVAELFEKENPKDQLFFHDTAAGKDVFYYVCSAYNEEESRSDEVLFVYDYTSQKKNQYKLKAPESVYAYINRISASGDRLALFRQDSDEGGNTLGLYAHILTEESLKSAGNREPFAEKLLTEGVDLYPAMQEYIDKPLPYYVLEYDMEYEAFSDRYYLLSKEGNQIITILNDGTLGNIWQEEKVRFSFFVQTPEGLQLFQRTAKEGETAEIFYLQEGEKKVLYQGEYIDSREACFDSKGNLLYVAGDGQHLIEWQVTTGERRKIFSAISECLKYPMGIIREENGDLAVFDGMGQMPGMKHVTGAGQAMEAVIRVRPTTFMDGTIKECLNNYAITHPGISFEYLEGGAWDAKDITLNQIYSDIAKGEGPDILVLTGQEMYTLARKECLLDLQEILEPGSCAGIYEGILRNGYVGDKMYLMTMSASAESFYVSREVWDKPTWNGKEFMEVVETLNAQQPLKAASFTSYEFDGPKMLLVRMINNLEGEGFVNTETGECHLDGEEFRKVLEFCKKFGAKENAGIHADMWINGTEGVEALKKGECAVLIGSSGDFSQFSQYHSSLGEDYCQVGPPGCGYGILEGGSGIAVNKSTPYLELIRDIVNTLYSPEYAMAAKGFTVPLSKDTLQGRVKDASNWAYAAEEKMAFVQLDSRSYNQVAAKPDGTSWLTEYLEYLEHIRPRPKERELEPVRTMILEESLAYFDGEKSLDEVVDLMQSRVSLYLAEQL